VSLQDVKPVRVQRVWETAAKDDRSKPAALLLDFAELDIEEDTAEESP